MRELEGVTRVEVIDPHGRVYAEHNCSVQYDIQDGGRTLKLFVDNRTPASGRVQGGPRRRADGKWVVDG